MSIVPQEALLLNGSLRENLDPFNEYRDSIIWEALDKVRLKDYFLKYYEKNLSKKDSSDSLGETGTSDSKGAAAKVIARQLLAITVILNITNRF